MRFRSDFVTNSSSSSYVIMYKKTPELPEEILEQYPFLKFYTTIFEKLFETDVETIKTKSELEEWMMDNFGLYYGVPKNSTFEQALEKNACGSEKKLYQEYLKKIEEGFTIAFKEVDYNDESQANMLESLNDGKNFIIKCNN